MTQLLKLAPYIIGCALLAACAWWLYSWGASSGRLRGDVALAEMRAAHNAALAIANAQHAQALEKATAERAEVEAKMRDGAAAADAKFKDYQGVRKHADTVISSLRADAVRMRKQCIASRPADSHSADSAVPGATDAGHMDHAAGYTGLGIEDAKNLVEIAADGDRYAVQLSACQAYVRSIVNPK